MVIRNENISFPFTISFLCLFYVRLCCLDSGRCCLGYSLSGDLGDPMMTKISSAQDIGSVSMLNFCLAWQCRPPVQQLAGLIPQGPRIGCLSIDCNEPAKCHFQLCILILNIYFTILFLVEILRFNQRTSKAIRLKRLFGIERVPIGGEFCQIFNLRHESVSMFLVDHHWLITRPGIAMAVLQTPILSIKWLIYLFPPNLQNITTPQP